MTVKEIVGRNGKTPDRLISVLTDLQKQKNRNYLSHEDLKAIADAMDLPESRVYSVATFYSLLSTQPRGKHIIRICRDVPCHVNGSFDLVAELKNILQIGIGETTRDGVFSIEYTSCLGCCEMSPVISVDDNIYGGMTADDLPRIIEEYRRL